MSEIKIDKNFAIELPDDEAKVYQEKYINYKGYRGDSLLKKAGVEMEWTPELLGEYAKCAQDPIYFMETYMKIISLDYGLVPFKLRDFQKILVRNIHNNRNTITVMARQSGKALSLDTPIMTPKGLKQFKDLHIGDTVYSPDGIETKIVFETPTMYDHECYDIEFTHGETITCDADHLWTVEILSRRRVITKTITTKELIPLFNHRKSQGQSIRIKCPEPLQFSEQDVSELDPYLLGVWLGDGHCSSGRITCHKDDFNEYKIENSIPYEYKPGIITLRVNNLTTTLKKLNLFENKHIPNNYIYNTLETRLAIIQGLMDTDGSVTDSGTCEFYQKNINLIHQFRFILSTLGVKSTIRSKIVDGETYYTIAFCNRKFQWFRLPRKQQKIKERFSGENSSQNYNFYIRSITKTDSIPVKCIQVEHSSHQFLCGNTLIPTHNSTAVVGYLLWYILFHQHVTVMLLAQKGDTAQEILGKAQLAYLHLPKFLQQGVKEGGWNKRSMALENGSRAISEATSSASVRGMTANILILDETAHIEHWEEFAASTLPVISSGKTTKVVMISTPKGLNHFYTYWQLAQLHDVPEYKWPKNQRWNGYIPLLVKWSDVPGRDEAWRIRTMQDINWNEEKFLQEYECEFQGSSGTLIAGWKLKQLRADTPILEKDGMFKYEDPKPGHIYTITVDVAEGKKFDYSAFQVIDVTKTPYEQVCVFHSNEVIAGDLASILFRTAKAYNDAWVLIEWENLGATVSMELFHLHEYENLLWTESAGKVGKRITTRSGSGVDAGLKMTQIVRANGCSFLKMLVEEDKLLIHDFHTIEELARFSRTDKKKKWEAEEGANDDLVMSLVTFAWLATQEYFKGLTNIDTIQELREKKEQDVAADLVPFGFIDRGQEISPTGYTTKELHEVLSGQRYEKELLEKFFRPVSSTTINEDDEDWKWLARS